MKGSTWSGEQGGGEETTTAARAIVPKNGICKRSTSRIQQHLVAGREELFDREADLAHPILKLRLDGSRDFTASALRAYHLHRPDLRCTRDRPFRGPGLPGCARELSVVKGELWEL